MAVNKSEPPWQEKRCRLLVGWLPLSHCPSEACEPQGLEADMCLRVQTGLMTPAAGTEWAHQTTGKRTQEDTHRVCGRCGGFPAPRFGVPQGPPATCGWTEFHGRATPDTGLFPLEVLKAAAPAVRPARLWGLSVSLLFTASHLQVCACVWRVTEKTGLGQWASAFLLTGLSSWGLAELQQAQLGGGGKA